MAITKNILIAQRYSEALVEIASSGELSYEKIASDLSIVRQTLEQSVDLLEVLNNPTVSIESKKNILIEVFKSEICETILNFLKVLIDRSRFDVFFDILEVFTVSVDRVNNIKRVQVVSAVEMTEQSAQNLKNKLEEKLHSSVVIDSLIDSSIIAGLVIKIGDDIIDMSLKHKLEDLSKSIAK